MDEVEPLPTLMGKAGFERTTCARSENGGSLENRFIEKHPATQNINISRCWPTRSSRLVRAACAGRRLSDELTNAAPYIDGCRSMSK